MTRMTRRERLEQRAARRLQWAAGRQQKATAALARASQIADLIPLGQPILVGHHSEGRARRDRARIAAGMRAGLEAQKMADHHLAKADGLQRQVDRSIFSDDPDAVDRLRERIASLEHRRGRLKRINAEIRRGAGWEARLRADGLELTAEERAQLLAIARYQPRFHADGRRVYPTFGLTNLSADLRRQKDRLESLLTEQHRA